MKKKTINTKNNSNFIGSWLIKEDSFTEIINYFNDNHEKHEASKLDTGLLDKSKRDSIELTITPKEIEQNNLTFFKNYILEIRECFMNYEKEWDYLSKSMEKSYISKFHVEKFLIGGHHIDYHFDRINISSSHKALSWITFLNNNDANEGSLEFKHFDCSIKPEKGLTLIFPSDWTHVHRQNILKTKEKFTIKGNIQLSEIESKK